MRGLIAMASVGGATLVQLALIASTSAGGDIRGLPLLPLAALAAWGAARGSEAWAGLLPAPLLLGLASDERAGWFLLALAPTPLLAAALRGPSAGPFPSTGAGLARLRGDLGAGPRGPRSALRILVVAAGAAGAGLVLYSALLAGVAGDARSLLDDARVLGRGTALTGLTAALLAAVLLQFRPRRRGLFG